MQALDAQLPRDAPLAGDLTGLLAPGESVNDIEQRKQDAADEQHWPQHGL
jgi:hypothetical protein